MNFPHSKMFVSNDLTKGSQTKRAVEKCYLSRKNISLVQQEKFRRKLKRN